VGTVTEIYDYLRILYARLGPASLPRLPGPLAPSRLTRLSKKIMHLPEGTKLYCSLHGPPRAEKYDALFEEVRRSGFVRKCASQPIVSM